MRHPLYLVEQGSKLSRSGRRLTVTKDENTLASAAVLQISQVIVYGNIQITTPALQLLLDEGIELVFLSMNGKFYGRLTGEVSGNGTLRVAQVLASQDAPFALATAQSIVAGKLHHMKLFLGRYARRKEEPALSEATARIDAMISQTSRCQTINSLMGVEGRATAVYFQSWRSLLKGDWRFEKRVRRPPTDPVNALASFAYTLLGQNVMSAVQAAGLDPYIGFLHQLSYNRPSLMLDLVEPFRSIVADSVVMRCLNNEIITKAHFETGNETRPIQLTQDGIRLFIRELETRLTQPFKHPVSGEQIHFRRLFLLEAYALAQTLPKRNPSEPFKPFRAR